MGKLIVTEFVTLDGVAQAPGGRDEDRDEGFDFGGWQMAFDDEAADEEGFRNASSMDALLLGRRTYDIFAGYWPTAPQEIPFTALLNRVPKYVASRTLSEPLSWEGATLLDGPVVDAVAAIKERHDEVHLIGSLDLLQSLLASDLVDRFNLWMYPVVVGDGKRVFDSGTVPTAFRLTKSTPYSDGALQLVYEPSGTPTFADMRVGRSVQAHRPSITEESTTCAP